MFQFWSSSLESVQMMFSFSMISGLAHSRSKQSRTTQDRDWPILSEKRPRQCLWHLLLQLVHSHLVLEAESCQSKPSESSVPLWCPWCSFKRCASFLSFTTSTKSIWWTLKNVAAAASQKKRLVRIILISNLMNSMEKMKSKKRKKTPWWDN